jgi:hypothetical protein
VSSATEHIVLSCLRVKCGCKRAMDIIRVGLVGYGWIERHTAGKAWGYMPASLLMGSPCPSIVFLLLLARLCHTVCSSVTAMSV